MLSLKYKGVYDGSGRYESPQYLTSNIGHTTMGIFKYLVTVGTHYIEHGTMDFEPWSERMLDTFGPAIKPFLKDIMKWSIMMTSTGDGNESIKGGHWDFEDERQTDNEH